MGAILLLRSPLLPAPSMWLVGARCKLGAGARSRSDRRRALLKLVSSRILRLRFDRGFAVGIFIPAETAIRRTIHTGHSLRCYRRLGFTRVFRFSTRWITATFSRS